MIPNKNGYFKKSDDIYVNEKENEKKIPEIINPIYKTIYNKEINDIIIYE